MKPIFRIELPPPESGNKTLRKHWSRRSKDNSDTAWSIIQAIKKDDIKIEKQKQGSMRYLVFYLESFKPQDDNNFQLSIKGLVDEFQEGRTVDLIIDDSPDYCRVFYIPIKTKKRKRKMFLEAYEQKEFEERLKNDSEFFSLFISKK